jgi:tripartite-type tricarboxylate transporter receptor subunit TctC
MSVCLCLGAGVARAQQDYPNRPIQIVVPFAPGGSIDITMRLIAPLLSKQLGQSVVVINRPGGAGTIGMNDVAKAQPDGYTFGAASFSFAANPSVLKTMPFDPLKDFEPVTMVAEAPLLVLVGPKTPVNTLPEFIDWVKSQPPGSLNYGSVGIASSGHLFTELFLSRAGIKMVHVPFTNGGREPLAQGLTQLQLGPIAADIAWVRDGRMKALAVTSAAADPNLPDLPPVSQTLPGFEAFEWPGLVAPKGTPRAIIDRIRAAVVQAIADPDVKKRFDDLGMVAVGSTPEQFSAFISKQVATWGDVVRQIDLKPQ